MQEKLEKNIFIFLYILPDYVPSDLQPHYGNEL